MIISVLRRSGFFLIPAVLICSSPLIKAQNINDYRARVYNSYTAGRMSDWQTTLGDMEKEYRLSGNNDLLYEILIAQYGYIGFCIKEDHKKEASFLLEKAMSNLEILKTQDPENAKWLAFEGALLGYEMGLNKFKVMILGPRARDKIDAAVEKDPGQVRTLLEKANQLNFSPKIAGGDTEQAIEYYLKAINILESDTASLKNNWIYINTLVVMAQAYEKTGRQSEACAIYKKIIVFDPGINWVRNDLYSGCTGKEKI